MFALCTKNHSIQGDINTRWQCMMYLIRVTEQNLKISFAWNSADAPPTRKTVCKAVLPIAWWWKYNFIHWTLPPKHLSKYSFPSLSNPLLPPLLVLLPPKLPGEVMLLTTPSGEGGERMPLVYPNPSFPESFLPSPQSHSTSSHLRHLGWNQAPTSNAVKGRGPRGCVFSQPGDEGGQWRLAKGRQGFKQRA